MEWKYRKDYKIMPGVHLKYGSQGIHTQIISHDTAGDAAFDTEKLRHALSKPYEDAHAIQSASIDQLTPEDLKVFKEILIASHRSFNETSSLLNARTTAFAKHSKKLNGLERSLFRFLFRKKISRMQTESVTKKEEVDELTTQLSYASVRLEIDSDEHFHQLYTHIRRSFEYLSRCEKKWDFTSSKATNRVAERTSASNTITRTEITIGEKHNPIINTEYPALCFHNINGGDLYFYPGFILIYESKSTFAIISYKDVSVEFKEQRFIEEEKVPGDTKVVDHTWFKVNKNGSPDKRFANNYQIPIVIYGRLHFTSPSGLNEVYCFSNPELPMFFQKAFQNYTDALQSTSATATPPAF